MDNFTSSQHSKTIKKGFCIFLIIVGLGAGIVSLSAQTVIQSQSTVQISAVVGTTTDGGGGGGGGSGGGGSGGGSSGGGGGGGGGYYPPPQNEGVIFKGLAYPSNIVTLLKNGVIVSEVPAGSDGSFQFQLSGLTPGTYSFGVRAEDEYHLQSTLDLFTVFIASGVTTVVDGIFLPPTITVSNDEVKKGDIQTIYGKSVPNASIALVVHSDVVISKTVKASDSGTWLYKLDTTPLEYGGHISKARSQTDTDISSYSGDVAFTVGTVNRLKTSANAGACGAGFQQTDINCDGRVNLIDFSILAFWYHKTGFSTSLDFNKDGAIDLIDFSIMAYHWTG